MDLNQAFKVIQETFDSLQRVGLVEKTLQIGDQTVILGSGSPLDSIGFVTFISELEDRLIQISGSPDTVLVLNDIHAFNPEGQMLTAGTIAKYVSHLTGMSETALHD